MKLEKETKLLKSEVWKCCNMSAITFTGCLSNEELEKLQSNTNKNIKLTLEVEEPILDKKEKEYLSGVIRPFRDRIRYITKNAYIMSGDKREFISICTFNGVTPLPYFKAGTMYTNMELNKEYTLEDLDL